MLIDRNDRVGKTFVKFVSANILSMLAMSFYILADTMFIANGVGSDGLTALNIVLPFYSILNGTGLILGMGGATRYSIARGAGDDRIADRIFTEVFIIGCAFGLIYTVLGLAIPEQICRMLGADDSVIGLAVTYLRSLSICNLPFVVNHIILAFVRNDNSPRLAMTAVIGSSLFNILFDWMLIYPCDLGIFGASFATGFSSVVSIVIASLHFVLKKNNFKLVKPKFVWADISFSLAAGFPSLINELANGIVIFVFNTLLYKLGGNVAINAFSVVANLSLVAVFTFNGVAQGTQPLLSYYYGASNRKNIYKTFVYAIVTVIGLAVTFYMSFYFARDFFIGLFNKDNSEEMLVLAREAVKLYDIAFFGSSLNIVCMALFSSCGRQAFSFILSLMRGLFMPVGYAFAFAHLWQITGIWIAVPVSEFTTLVVGMMLLVLWFGYMRKKFVSITCEDIVNDSENTIENNIE